MALAILRSSISVAYFTSFPELLKLSEVVHFNLLTCIFWRRTTCSVEYAPLGSLQWAKLGVGSDGWKICHFILSSCVNALKKEQAPLGSSYNGRKSPYGHYLVSEPVSSFHPWKATAEHETISSALRTESKGIWQPILWSSHNRFLEASPVFGILTQVLSSDEIPFAWPWWFWLQFCSKPGLFWTKDWENRTGIEGRKLSNTLIGSKTALSKHWPTPIPWSLPEWIICNNPLWLSDIHCLCKLGFPKYGLIWTFLKSVNGFHFFYDFLVLCLISFSLHKWPIFPLAGISLYDIKCQRVYNPVQFSSVQSISHVWLFATPWIAAHQVSLSITTSWSSLKLTSMESVMPIQPSYPLLFPSPPAPNPSQHQSLFQWVNSLHEVAKVLEFQL